MEEPSGASTLPRGPPRGRESAPRGPPLGERKHAASPATERRRLVGAGRARWGSQAPAEETRWAVGIEEIRRGKRKKKKLKKADNWVPPVSR